MILIETKKLTTKEVQDFFDRIDRVTDSQGIVTSFDVIGSDGLKKVKLVKSDRTKWVGPWVKRVEEDK